MDLIVTISAGSICFYVKLVINNMTICRGTTDAFCLRWNNYKDNDRKFHRNQSCMQQHLYENFCNEGQDKFLGNVSISLIDKTDGF